MSGLAGLGEAAGVEVVGVEAGVEVVGVETGVEVVGVGELEQPNSANSNTRTNITDNAVGTAFP